MDTLELKMKIEKYKDGLVECAEQLCDNHTPKVANTSLQNLLALANSTSSVKEIQNFIKYQMGRSTMGENWTVNNFGEKLISKLDGIKNEYHLADNEEDKKLFISLVRLFIGYIVRYTRYLEVKNRKQRERR